MHGDLEIGDERPEQVRVPGDSPAAVYPDDFSAHRRGGLCPFPQDQNHSRVIHRRGHNWPIARPWAWLSTLRPGRDTTRRKPRFRLLGQAWPGGILVWVRPTASPLALGRLAGEARLRRGAHTPRMSR